MRTTAFVLGVTAATFLLCIAVPFTIDSPNGLMLLALSAFAFGGAFVSRRHRIRGAIMMIADAALVFGVILLLVTGAPPVVVVVEGAAFIIIFALLVVGGILALATRDRPAMPPPGSPYPPWPPYPPYRP